MSELYNQLMSWIYSLLPFLRNSETLSILLTLCSLILAVLACFEGYRLFPCFVAGIGFLCGAFLGYTVCIRFSSELWILLVCILAAGSLLGFAAVKLIRPASFVIIAVLTALIACGLLSVFVPEFTPLLNCIGGLIIGIIAGIFCAWLQRPVIILASGFYGALAASQSFLKLIRFQNTYVFYGLILILAIAGVCWQFLHTRR